MIFANVRQISNRPQGAYHSRQKSLKMSHFATWRESDVYFQSKKIWIFPPKWDIYADFPTLCYRKVIPPNFVSFGSFWSCLHHPAYKSTLGWIGHFGNLAYKKGEFVINVVIFMSIDVMVLAIFLASGKECAMIALLSWINEADKNFAASKSQQ